jgi:hypothetical protein
MQVYAYGIYLIAGHANGIRELDAHRWKRAPAINGVWAGNPGWVLLYT